MDDLSKCNQEGCGADAVATFVWPGRDRKGTCAEHRETVRNVARALGFEIEFQPLEPAPTVDPPTVHQRLGVLSNHLTALRENMHTRKHPLEAPFALRHEIDACCTMLADALQALTDQAVDEARAQPLDRIISELVAIGDRLDPIDRQADALERHASALERIATTLLSYGANFFDPRCPKPVGEARCALFRGHADQCVYYPTLDPVRT